VDLPESPERRSAAPEPADPEEAGDDPTGTKRKAQLAFPEPAKKRRRPKPAARDLRCPKTKKVAKQRAIAIAG
jgi:hypothetical protein